jgi:hypothetical protein
VLHHTTGSFGFTQLQVWLQQHARDRVHRRLLVKTLCLRLSWAKRRHTFHFSLATSMPSGTKFMAAPVRLLRYDKGAAVGPALRSSRISSVTSGPRYCSVWELIRAPDSRGLKRSRKHQTLTVTICRKKDSCFRGALLSASSPPYPSCVKTDTGKGSNSSDQS